MTCNPLKWTDADQRAEDIANSKERDEGRLTDNARAIAAPLMVLMEYMAAQNLKLNVGPCGTDPREVMDILVDWLGVEPSARQKREAAEAQQSLVLRGWLPHTPEGQA